MGYIWSKIRDVYDSFKDNPAKVVMLGLDAAGKTTTLYRIAFKEEVTTIPTIGFNVEMVSPCEGLTMTVWDVGFAPKLRPLWRHYFHNIDGLIYVIDCNDLQRMDECREVLDQIVEADETEGVPLLVLANKQDLPHAESLPKIINSFGLQTLPRPWNIQACCAVNGNGVFEGMQKLTDMIKNFKRNKNT